MLSLVPLKEAGRHNSLNAFYHPCVFRDELAAFVVNVQWPNRGYPLAQVEMYLVKSSLSSKETIGLDLSRIGRLISVGLGLVTAINPWL